MVFLIIAGAVAFVLFGAACAFRYGLPIPKSLTWCCFSVILAGSVLGHELFHIPAPIPITSDRAMLALFSSLFALRLFRRNASLNNVVMLDVVIGALIAVIFVSTLTTDWQFSNNLPVSRLLFYYLMPVAVYLIVKNTHCSDRELTVIMMALVVFGVYLAVVAVCEVKGLHPLVYPRYIIDSESTEFFGRARGPFLNPISNGIFLTTALACAVGLFWTGKLKIKLAAVAAGGLLAGGNILTLTRSVWLGMVLGVGAVVFAITNRRQKAVLLLGGAAAGVLLIAVLGESLISFKRDKEVTQAQMSQSAELRPIFATIAWGMFKDRPIFGHGFGQYKRSKLDYLRTPNSGLQLEKGRKYLQHNVFLSLLTEIGAIGCGLLMLLLAHGFQLSVQLYYHEKSSTVAKHYALVTFALLTSYVVNGMFHDTSIIPMANMLMFFFLGVVVRFHQQYQLSTEVLQFDVPSAAEIQPAAA